MAGHRSKRRHLWSLEPSTSADLLEVVNSTVTLLAKPPDKVYMQGFYARSGGVQLILAAAEGVIATTMFDPTSSMGLELCNRSIRLLSIYVAPQLFSSNYDTTKTPLN